MLSVNRAQIALRQYSTALRSPQSKTYYVVGGRKDFVFLSDQPSQSYLILSHGSVLGFSLLGFTLSGVSEMLQYQ